MHLSNKCKNKCKNVFLIYGYTQLFTTHASTHPYTHSKHTYTYITARKLNVLLSSCESKLQETQNIQFITIGNLSGDWCLLAVYKCAAHVFFGFVCGYGGSVYVLHGTKGAVAVVVTRFFALLKFRKYVHTDMTETVCVWGMISLSAYKVQESDVKLYTYIYEQRAE